MAEDAGVGPPPAQRRSGLVRAPQNLAAGLCLLAVAGFALWASAGLPRGSLRAVGAGMMPRGVALLIAVAGAGLVAASLVRHGEALERWAWRGPLFITLAVVAFALTIRSPGLVVAGPLVAIVGGAASPETRPKELLVFGVVITAFCIGLFRYVLHLPIPVLVLPGVVTI